MKIANIAFLLLILASVMIMGCDSTTGDDRQVLSVAREGTGKIVDNMKLVNDLSGSALDYKLSQIQRDSHSYHARMLSLNPDTEEMKNLRRIGLDYFWNAELWAQNLRLYLKSHNNKDLDQANLYKTKMMDAVREINRLN